MLDLNLFGKKKKRKTSLSFFDVESLSSEEEIISPRFSEFKNNLKQIDIINDSYCLTKLDARQIVDANQITKERNVLIYYFCGSTGMKAGDNLEELIYEKDYLFKLMSNHLNFCDREYTREYLNSDFNPKGFLATPNTIFGRRINYKILEGERLIDSANMTLELWKKLGRVIRNNYEDYDAFIILHGSDTMTYSASILSFMLENLNKPVILTGSKIPLAEMRNDAQKNLVDALTIAGFYDIPEVCILFGSELLRGNRTIRADNMDFNTFESPNMRPLAHLGTQIKVNWDLILKKPDENFTYFDDLENRISTVKFFPMIDDNTFQSFFDPPIEAVVIETYGVGNIPLNRSKIIEIMKSASDRGVIILNVSQCKKGEVSTFYETGDILKKIGVTFGQDMTVECALAKLSYLMGKKYEKKTIKKLLDLNLRGELTIKAEEFFSMQSNSFINNILNIMDLKSGCDKDSHHLFKNLIPSIINELVEQRNLLILKKFENEIRQITDFSKKNPFHIAAKIGDVTIIHFLLRFKNIKINSLDDKKMTPLNYACFYKNSEAAMLLKEKGAILNEDPSLKLGLLFCKLAFNGDLDHIKLFYECGANLMIGDYEKRTIAHISAAENRIDIIKFLLEQTNYNLMENDLKGRTPMDDCHSQNIRNMLIEKYGKGLKKFRLKIKKIKQQ